MESLKSYSKQRRRLKIEPGAPFAYLWVATGLRRAMRWSADENLKRLGADGEAFVDEVDDVLGGGAGEEDFGDAGFFHGGDVGFGDDAADEDGDVVHAFGFEQGHELGADGVVRAGQDGEADDVDVFLNGGGGDHLGSLAQAGVDDFHAGVAQGAGDDFCAAVVAVEAGLGDEDADFLCGHGWHRLASVAEL